MLPPHYQYTDHDIYELGRPVYSGIILGTSPFVLVNRGRDRSARSRSYARKAPYIDKGDAWYGDISKL